MTALWKTWWLYRFGSVAAAAYHAAGRPHSYRPMQRCAPFVCSIVCGQNVNTATGRKQLMESPCERNKKWTFHSCVEFKMEKIAAFQLPQQKVVCGGTVICGSVLDQLKLAIGT